MNLKTKLRILFIGIAILPLGIFSFIAYKQFVGMYLDAEDADLKVSQTSIQQLIEEKEKNLESLLLAWSSSDWTLSSVRGFQEGLKVLRGHGELSSAHLEEKRKKLYDFYLGPLKASLAKQGEQKSLDDHFRHLDWEAVLLQYHYLAENPFAINEKWKHKSALEPSPYSVTHGIFHPIWSQAVHEFALSDAYIVEAGSGRILYSTTKGMDFGVQLTSTYFKDSNLGKFYFEMSKKAGSESQIVKGSLGRSKDSQELAAMFWGVPLILQKQVVAYLIAKADAGTVGIWMQGQVKDGGVSLRSEKEELFYLDARFSNEDWAHYWTMTQGGEQSIQEIESRSGTPTWLSRSQITIADQKWEFLLAQNRQSILLKAEELKAWFGFAGVVTLGVVLVLGTILGRTLAQPILRIAQSLGDSARLVASASGEISTGSQKLSETSTQQATAIEETSASLEEMTGMVETTVQNAEKSITLTDSVASTSTLGNQAMVELIIQMREILDSNAKIEKLVRVIGEIGERTQLIDEIVFQTKLLSFNASVEAERAGEHGRGFAVVAQEVGNLAQMSGKAAQEISAIVKESIKNAESVSVDNKAKVEKGNELVEEAAKLLKEISEKASLGSQNAHSILNASKEQLAGIRQINQAVSSLDRGIQMNAGMAEKTATSTFELSAQAVNLSKLVQMLSEIVHGAGDQVLDGPTVSGAKVRQLFKPNEEKAEVAAGKSSGSDVDWDKF